MSEKEKEIAAYAAEQINRLPYELQQRIGDIARGMDLANELAAGLLGERVNDKCEPV